MEFDTSCRNSQDLLRALNSRGNQLYMSNLFMGKGDYYKVSKGNIGNICTFMEDRK